MSKEFIYVADLKILLVRQKNFRNLNLRISQQDATLRVNAPLALAESYIKNFILKNLSKIKSALANINVNQATQPKFIDGQLHYLWGQAYPLKIVKSKRNHIALQDGIILLELAVDFNNMDMSEIGMRYLNNFYRNELKNAIPTIMQKYLLQMNLNISEWRVKNMKTRWGTCNITQKRIWLNLQLAKKPLECLELVIVHELAHLFERKHTPYFYSIVAKYYPNWERSEKLLQNSNISSC